MTNILCFVFFFQAEDGIRDGHVTGVQTCALPILKGTRAAHVCDTPRRDLAEEYRRHALLVFPSLYEGFGLIFLEAMASGRSEERRVGKEGRWEWWMEE